MRILRERIESDEARQTVRSLAWEAAKKLVVELLVSALRTVWVVTVAGATLLTGVPFAVEAAKAAPTWVVPSAVSERLDAIANGMNVLVAVANRCLESATCLQ